MAGLKIAYDKLREYANSAEHFAEILDEGIGTADEVAAAVDGILVGITGALGVGAIGVGAVVATNTYFFTEVRPTATHTRDFLRELADYFRQVAANLEAADGTANDILTKVEKELGLPPGTLKNPVDSAASGILGNAVKGAAQPVAEEEFTMASVQDAGLLKADYAALQNATSQINGLYDTLAQINNDLIHRTQVVASASGSGLWSGQASRTFAVRLSETAQAVQTTLQQLKAAGDSIPMLIATIQDADAQSSALFAASE